jgi:hypothetical protein
MYLFIRSGQMQRERALEALTFATEICGEVEKVTGVEVHAWSVLYGDEINNVSWTARAESHAAMGAISAKLQADAGYMARTAEAAELFTTAPIDTFAEVLATVNETDALGTYSSVVMAQCAAGKIAEAMAWGVDIFNHVGKVTGRPGLFIRSLYGPWASLAWVALADTLEEVDAASTAMSSDPGYIEMIDQAGDLFLPGSGQSRLSQRIA